MQKGRKKSDLPQKICLTCGRPMVWRKKWRATWDAVKYCSERCRRSRPAAATHPQTTEKDSPP